MKMKSAMDCLLLAFTLVMMQIMMAFCGNISSLTWEPFNESTFFIRPSNGRFPTKAELFELHMKKSSSVISLVPRRNFQNFSSNEHEREPRFANPNRKPDDSTSYYEDIYKDHFPTISKDRSYFNILKKLDTNASFTVATADLSTDVEISYTTPWDDPLKTSKTENFSSLQDHEIYAKSEFSENVSARERAIPTESVSFSSYTKHIQPQTVHANGSSGTSTEKIIFDPNDTESSTSSVDSGSEEVSRVLLQGQSSTTKSESISKNLNEFSSEKTSESLNKSKMVTPNTTAISITQALGVVENVSLSSNPKVDEVKILPVVHREYTVLFLGIVLCCFGVVFIATGLIMLCIQRSKKVPSKAVQLRSATYNDSLRQYQFEPNEESV